MNEEYREYVDRHAVDHVHAGFDFQFFAFLYLLLDIDKGETIMYESDDDILLVKSDGTNVLIQVKHGINKATGSLSMLTQLDEALWKTIKNWMILNVLSNDENYISDRIFQIFTNKSIDSKNKLVNLISQYSKGEISINKIIDLLNELKKTTKSDDIINCIEKLLDLDLAKQKQFFKKLIILQYDNIIKDIKDRLKYKKNVPENRIDDVFAGLIKEFKISHYHDSVKRDKTVIEADEIYKRIRNIINPTFTRILNIDRSVDYELPTDISGHIFVRQLLDIDYLDTDDTADIKEIFIKKIETENKLYQEQIAFNIGSTQFDRINKTALDVWSVKHDQSSLRIRRDLKKGNSVDESRYQESGLDCFQEMMTKIIEPMDLEMTNGFFYSLSDKPTIGWRHDWKDKYKKNE